MNIESSVRKRYSQGALEIQAALCCPVSYDSSLLAALPEEILEKDYGCGDPSRYVQEGDVVLDLGSGGGKICYMAAQLVGSHGQVIGIDVNDAMLTLARKYQGEMASRLGGDRVRFLKGYIQDLALDLDALETWLQKNPVCSQRDYAELRSWEYNQRLNHPMIPDASVDLVISNCVLNLVPDHEKQQLVDEIFRVLKPGGRIAISDIVSDKPVPAAMKEDAELWSGCISGAFQEAEFLQSFAARGFRAVCYDKWESKPWRVIDGIEFRSVTLTALKVPIEASGKPRHTLIYAGPFAEVTDESGCSYPRGKRIHVTDAEHVSLTSAAYRGAFIDPESHSGTASSSTACCSSPSKAENSGSANGCCG
jgi:ubiquinone/menaquinone biosynthesis C-methylase UbiE